MPRTLNITNTVPNTYTNQTKNLPRHRKGETEEQYQERVRIFYGLTPQVDMPSFLAMTPTRRRYVLNFATTNAEAINSRISQAATLGAPTKNVATTNTAAIRTPTPAASLNTETNHTSTLDQGPPLKKDGIYRSLMNILNSSYDLEVTHPTAPHEPPVPTGPTHSLDGISYSPLPLPGRRSIPSKVPNSPTTRTPATPPRPRKGYTRPPIDGGTPKSPAAGGLMPRDGMGGGR